MNIEQIENSLWMAQAQRYTLEQDAHPILASDPIENFNLIREQIKANNMIPAADKDIAGLKLIIKVYNNFAEFKKRVLQTLQTRAIYDDETLVKAANAFANYAAIKSNPNQGSIAMWKSVSDFKRLYYRPIISLAKLCRGDIRGHYANDTDRAALADGKKFKVMKMRGKEVQIARYFESYDEALGFARIKTRGMLRVMWGLNLPKFGARIPRSISMALRDSPGLVEYSQLNDVFISDEGERRVITLINGAPVAYRYKKSIVDRSYKYAEKVLHSVTAGKIKSLVQTYLKDKAPGIQSDIFDIAVDYHLHTSGADGVTTYMIPTDLEEQINAIAPEGLNYSNGEFSGEFTIQNNISTTL